MNSLRAAAVGCVLLAAAGCTSIRHYPTDRLAVGAALPVEVSVQTKAGRAVEGTVFYRTSGSGRFQESAMTYRAGELYTELPTETLEANERVEYYIDVHLDGTLYALGTPGSPFVVSFIDRRDMILSSLGRQVFASDTAHEVRIVLLAEDQPVGQPTITYMIPGVPGEIRTPMVADGYGNYQMFVPAQAVRSGTWKYAIDVPVEGSDYRVPAQGYESFSVTAIPTMETLEQLFEPWR